MNSARSARPALWISLVGLAATAFAIVVIVSNAGDDGLLAEHLRSAYPNYTDADVNAATLTSVVLLASIGVLGAICWLVMIMLIAKRWRSRLFATIALILGTVLCLVAVLTPDTSGELGFAPLVSASLLVPCLAGAALVVVLRRDRSMR